MILKSGNKVLWATEHEFILTASKIRDGMYALLNQRLLGSRAESRDISILSIEFLSQPF